MTEKYDGFIDVIQAALSDHASTMSEQDRIKLRANQLKVDKIYGLEKQS